jgi:hypothetical protein
VQEYTSSVPRSSLLYLDAGDAKNVTWAAIRLQTQPPGRFAAMKILPRRCGRWDKSMQGYGETLNTVIPSEARNLALSVFNALLDSSSPASPRNDSKNEFSHIL